MGAASVNRNAGKVIPETFRSYHVAFFSFTYKNVLSDHIHQAQSATQQQGS